MIVAVITLVAVLIVIAIIVAGTLYGVSNETTQLGAEIFVVARLVQAIVHILGIPWIRTGAFFVGIGAEVAMLIEIGVPYLPTLFVH